MVAISLPHLLLAAVTLSTTALAAPAAAHQGLYPRDFPAPTGTAYYAPTGTAYYPSPTGTSSPPFVDAVQLPSGTAVASGAAWYPPSAVASSFHWPAPRPTAEPIFQGKAVLGRTFRFGW